MPNFTTPEDAGWFLDEYDAERFWSHVNRRGGQAYLDDPVSRLPASAGECWVWVSTEADAYVRFRVYSSWQPAHRIGLLEFGGNVPAGMDVDHLCRNRSCVRHNHLEPVTHKVNMERGSRAQATECKHGHEYTEENTVVQHRPNGVVRYCRTCLRAFKHATYLKSKRKSA